MPDLESPNVNSIEAWEFEPQRVDKPWGYELIWAHTDLYVGRSCSSAPGTR